MPQDTKDLLIKPLSSETVYGETLLVTPESTGYQYLTLSIRKLLRGEKFQSETAATELGLVVLGGRCSVESTAGSWSDIGSRAHVFDGLPSAVYLPIETGFTISAETDCELALCLSRAEVRFPGRLVTPEFPAQRLLLVEVYTPSGNWSSYPPHKHDIHNPPDEVDLEELYYYKVDRPEGYAIQRVYTTDGRLDQTLTVR